MRRPDCAKSASGIFQSHAPPINAARSSGTLSLSGWRMSIDFEKVKHDSDLSEVAGRYCNLTARGGKWWSLCPFHEDTKANNFNIYKGRDGASRYRCFSCGEGGDVVDFVSKIEGISAVEAIKMLERNTLPDVGTYVKKQLPPSQSNEWHPIVPVPPNATEYEPSRTLNPNHGRIVDYRWMMERLDPYYNAEGDLMFYVIRCRYPDGGKMTPVISWCRGPNGEELWAAKRPLPPFPLMGLDEITANPEKKVILVSGEKCRAALAPVFPEVVVATWLGGDEAIKDTDWSPLVNVPSILEWADKDAPGTNAMNKIAKIIDGIEKSGTG
jgi:hypothetical protein